MRSRTTRDRTLETAAATVRVAVAALRQGGPRLGRHVRVLEAAGATLTTSQMDRERALGALVEAAADELARR